MIESGGSMPAYDYITFPRQFISYRWYKPLLVLALGFVFMLVFQAVLIAVAAVWNGDIDFILNYEASYDAMDAYTGPGALFEIGGVAVMLPALALAALIVRDRPYSSYSSSRGGWNWSAFAKCLGIAIVVMGLSTVVDLFLLGNREEVFASRFTAAGVILCVVLIPFQCAAEEYVFRGFVMQSVGSWFKLPVVGPALGLVVSAFVFAAGHPYNDVGVVLIFFNGVIWGLVAWQTKGLEATSAVHIVNNYLAFFLSGSGIQPSTSEVDIASLFMALAVDAIYAAVVILLGKRFNWFKSKGDGAAAFNERKRAKMAAKEQRRLAQQAYPQYLGDFDDDGPEPPVPRHEGNVSQSR